MVSNINQVNFIQNQRLFKNNQVNPKDNSVFDEFGDVNGDSKVDIVDSLLISQYYVGSNIPNFHSQFADVNLDGIINIVDSLLISQYYVGSINKMPCHDIPLVEGTWLVNHYSTQDILLGQENLEFIQIGNEITVHSIKENMTLGTGILILNNLAAPNDIKSDYIIQGIDLRNIGINSIFVLNTNNMETELPHNLINNPSIFSKGPGDIILPVVRIVSPIGSTVSATIIVECSATDNIGISKVEFFIDDILQIADRSSPYSFEWDTRTNSDGSHNLKVIAYDLTGNINTEIIAVNVDNQIENPVRKYAVLVGISDYKAISDLEYCDEDATDWYNFLIGPAMNYDEIWVFGDLHSSNYPKYDGIATEKNVKDALQNMVNLADDNDIIMFATSGHGAGDGFGSSYLCMWDCASGESGEDGDFYDTELTAILENTIADRIHIFIDHCLSGGFGPDLMNMKNSEKVYCTTTCSDDGYGYDDPAYKNGQWTYYFLEFSWISHFGGSSTVSLEEVYTYAHSNYPNFGSDECEEYDGSFNKFYLA